MIDQEHIRLLITEKLTGSITSEDDIFLQRCIQDDIEVELLWKEMQSRWSGLQGDEVITRIDANYALASVKNNFDEQLTFRDDLPVAGGYFGW